MEASGADWQPDREELRAIRAGSAAKIKQTPVTSLASLSRRCGGEVALKLENLQRTGSFKLRGVLSRLRLLEGERGVVAASAGNHGQSLAYAARLSGRRCVVYMPVGAALSKVQAVTDFGAEVRQAGEFLDDSIEAARAAAAEEDLLFVHPFDDLEIVKGQAGIGLELIEQVPDLSTVIVPVGGGGLISGIAAALAASGAKARVIGVQAAACPPFARSINHADPAVTAASATIADGIAVKRPGDLTLALAERWVDQMAVVDEEAIAEAMVLLAERGKLVVEGAGAAAVAGLLSGAVAPASVGTTVAVLSGGNVDLHLLARIIDRHQTKIGRRGRIFTRVDDRPGGLAPLLQIVAGSGGNVLDVTHVRDGVSLALDQTGVEIAIEARSSAHQAEVISLIEAAGYPVETV